MIQKKQAVSINGAVSSADPGAVNATTDNDDNRRVPRRPISHIAHVATGFGPPLECQMKDVSESGARITANYPKSAPQEFLLLLNNDLLRWCRVIWRSDREIGINFIDTPKSLTTAEIPASPQPDI